MLNIRKILKRKEKAEMMKQLENQLKSNNYFMATIKTSVYVYETRPKHDWTDSSFICNTLNLI